MFILQKKKNPLQLRPHLRQQVGCVMPDDQQFMALMPQGGKHITKLAVTVNGGRRVIDDNQRIFRLKNMFPKFCLVRENHGMPPPIIPAIRVKHNGGASFGGIDEAGDFFGERAFSAFTRPKNSKPLVFGKKIFHAAGRISTLSGETGCDGLGVGSEFPDGAIRGSFTGFSAGFIFLAKMDLSQMTVPMRRGA